MKSTKYLFVDPTTQTVTEHTGVVDLDLLRSRIGCGLLEMWASAKGT